MKGSKAIFIIKNRLWDLKTVFDTVTKIRGEKSFYNYDDLDPEWAHEYDSAIFSLLKFGIIAGEVDGTPMQLFTAYHWNCFDKRERLAHRIGGQRSFVGWNASVTNAQLTLPCPGKGAPNSSV